MEHDPNLAQLSKKRLEELEYWVDLAHDGAEGVEMCQRQYYDVLIVDYKIPVYDGLEVIRILRERGSVPATIMLTGIGHEEAAVEALRLGAGDYVVKDANLGYLDLLPSVIEKALERQRLEKEREQMLTLVQERNRALAMLNRVNHELTSILNMDTLRDRLMRTTLEVSGAEGCSLWLWGEARRYLICRAVIHRRESPPLEGTRVSKGQGIVGWVAQNNRSTIVQNVSEDVRFFAEIDTRIDFETHSIMAVPLRIQDEVIGVLEVVNKMEGTFGEEDLAIAGTLAASAATAIENARLVDALRQRTAELEDRNAELDAFAHTVAHDLQNMLARIVGFSELLAMDLELEDEESLPRSELRKSALIISRNSRKMSKVIEALLLLAAVRRASEVQLEKLNQREILHEALARLDEQIREQEAKVILPEVWPPALGYGPWVEEIWFNYLSNALKYGGETPVITLGAERIDDEMVLFWVQDQGPGIAPEDQTRLFTPFTQIGRKRKRGHGLGLSIVERITAKMGGHVAVESRLGRGSKFMFTLPAFIGENDRGEALEELEGQIGDDE